MAPAFPELGARSRGHPPRVCRAAVAHRSRLSKTDRNPVHARTSTSRRRRSRRWTGCCCTHWLGPTRRRRPGRRARQELIACCSIATTRGSRAARRLPGRDALRRPAGAVFHALVRKNYGCTHFIVAAITRGSGTTTAPTTRSALRPLAPAELGIHPICFGAHVLLPALTPAWRHPKPSRTTPSPM